MSQPTSQAYHLYGRKSYPQPLTFVGRLEVEATARLAEAALQLAGGNDWVELVAIPETSMVTVIVGGEPQ